MKRLLLSGLLCFAVSRTAFGYLNTGTVQVPPMDPQLVQIDDVNFVNRGLFQLDMSLLENPFGGNILYTTSDTQNYTNTGVMTSVPGFDFENFPASVGQAQMAANFVNLADGLGGGEIDVTNSSLFNIFGITLTSGAGTVKVRATNIVDSGLITADNTGLVDMSGANADFNGSRFVMRNGFGGTTTFGVQYLDWGSGLFGNTNNFPWFPAGQLTANTAVTPPFLSSQTGTFEEMDLTNATVYFESLNPQTNANGVIVWRGIYLQDSSPAEVTKKVYFGGSPFLIGTFDIEWAGAYKDPVTGQSATNYFYLSEEPTIRRSTNGFNANPPNDFEFAETAAPLTFFNAASAPGYVNPAPAGAVSNDFSYVSVKPTAVAVDTNQVIGGAITNLPGRIQLSASQSMNLANVRISGPNYLRLNSPVNFLGNSNAVIASPYTDLNLGVPTGGSLSLSNLLLPSLPSWAGVPGAPSAVFEFGIFSLPVVMGGVQAWSGSYTFVDANGITNDVQMLLVNSALEPFTPTFQQDVTLHSQDLVVSDTMNILRNFYSDATTLTVTTNGATAFSPEGELNLLNQNVFWSANLPNLQFLTNWGVISSANLANFAGNMQSPSSDPAGATPYQAFVNHGSIINQGTFIRANYFENSGVIEENLNNSMDIGVTDVAIATNSSFLAPLGSISITAGSLLLSNGVINAGQHLTLSADCSLSDGYVFGNEFGHITNALLPNVVTNGNFWTAGGGVRILVKPPTGDLLGTTITNIAANGENSINVWPGEDRGCSPAGYATNLALGRMILESDASPSRYTFQPAAGNNALYVDSIDFEGSVTNTDPAGNFPAITIAPGMKIYYAQATEGGVSIAEKLNGKNGGGFCWVSNYAGVYSSTNMQYPDGNTYIFNEALVISPKINSDGDGQVNKDDQTPIPIGWVFDINNIGPQPCGGGGTGGGTGGGGTGGTSGGGSHTPGTLSFPAESSNSSPVSFALAEGSYNGLFYDTNGVKPESSGFFTAKVTSKGGLSAKLQLGDQKYSFSKPPFDNTGHFNGTVSARGAATLTVDLQLVGNDQIAGTVSEGSDWSAKLLAQRAAFSSKNKAPWAGKETLLLSTVDTNSTTPAGDCFGAVKITASGSVQWSGTLPDGAKLTQKSALSKDGIWPLYGAPYGGAGTFIGWMQCTNSSDITGSGVWVAPAGASGLYPAGLTNELNATGSAATGSLGSHSRLTAVLSGSSLPASITNNISVFGKMNQSADGSLKLSVNLKTGLFSGSVRDLNSSQEFSFEGALLENSGVGGGFFLNANGDQGGKVYLTPAN